MQSLSFSRNIVLITVLFLLSCGKGSNLAIDSNPLEEPTLPYAIVNQEIHYLGENVQLNGVNSFNSFGPSDYDMMESWNVQIVREFIGNLGEMPIDGGAVQGADGQWIHSMQTLVDNNRSKGMVTILCPFGWISDQGELQLFTGLNPPEQSFYDTYKVRMRSIADHFKDQPDVWIEIWNEPYSWRNANGYTHDMWLEDAIEMVDNLRSVEGFESIILVPGNEQGQGDEAILEKGSELLKDRYNILFDLHAYGKWHKEATTESIMSRIEALLNKDFAILFGEAGVITEGSTLDDPQNFLQAVEALGISTLAWVWLKNSDEQNALLTEDFAPNNHNNNNWGDKFKSFLEK